MKARVLKTTGSWYTVLAENGQKYRCTIRGKLRLKGSTTTNPVVVGDEVVIDLESDGETAVISAVNDRKNYIIRRSSNLSREAHIIASNLDQAILVVTVDFPETHPEFIDRYLATAEAYQIPAIIVFNKTDIYDDLLNERLNDLLSIYRPLYRCIRTSALRGENIDLLKDLLKNKVSLISGNSGVGKSTLVNCIEPQLNLKTAEISHYHQKGKHTTTFSEMFPLSFGGFIIDTPGIKGFGVVDMNKNEMFHFFPEIFSAATKCQFYNCTHIHEPGCAVIEAVQKGYISNSRYTSYYKMINDNKDKYR